MDTTHLSPTTGGEAHFRLPHEPGPDQTDAAFQDPLAHGPPSVSDLPPTPERPRRRTRKLILCFDGTGNKFRGDDSDSNILKIFRMLDRTADDQCELGSPAPPTTDPPPPV